MATYEQLLAEVQKLQSDGRIPTQPTREQRVDWAYGNTKIENADVTREMAENAVNARHQGE